MEINRDWTVKEERIPRIGDVVIDTNNSYGLIVSTTGEWLRKTLDIEDVNGMSMYTNEDCRAFKIADITATAKFYYTYKTNKGWIVNKVYNLKGKDYPLQLINMEFDKLKRKMIYVFKDLNAHEEKFLRTSRENLIEPVSGYLEEAVKCAFNRDYFSNLSHQIEISIRELDVSKDCWSVAGQSFAFPDEYIAKKEIRKWIARMNVRRIASVLSNSEFVGSYFIVAVSNSGNLYITAKKDICGQPGVFNSRFAAGIALTGLDERIWKDALEDSIDFYDNY